MLTANIRHAIEILIGHLEPDRSPYDRSLAERLKGILEYEGLDPRSAVRASISLADWNYFQSGVNGAAVMHSAYASSREPWAPGLAEHFAEKLRIAQSNQQIIDMLMRFGWTNPPAER